MSNLVRAILGPVARKFKTLEQVARISDTFRRGRIIVAKNGSYDILHAGHIDSLYKSRAQGDMLIVGLDSDESIRKRKCAGRPINSQGDRTKVLCALECIDYITLIEDSIAFVEAVKPHIYTNDEVYGINCIEAETVKRNGGKVVIYPKVEGYSTTDLIDKLRGSTA